MDCALTAVIRDGQLFIPRFDFVPQSADEALILMQASQVSQLAAVLRRRKRMEMYLRSKCSVWTSIVLATAMWLFVWANLVSAQEADVVAAGQKEFRRSCVLCHGLSGHGESVMTTFNLLKVTPPDLKQLSKRNKGKFPFWRVYRIIDGREEIFAHGTRDMPIWGDVFIRQEDTNLAADTRAIGRILTIVYYLQSVQEH